MRAEMIRHLRYYCNLGAADPGLLGGLVTIFYHRKIGCSIKYGGMGGRVIVQKEFMLATKWPGFCLAILLTASGFAALSAEPLMPVKRVVGLWSNVRFRFWHGVHNPAPKTLRCKGDPG